MRISQVDVLYTDDNGVDRTLTLDAGAIERHLASPMVRAYVIGWIRKQAERQRATGHDRVAAR
jgi:hypothetical protein